MAECEDDVLESWEDAAESDELERRMEARQKDFGPCNKLGVEVQPGYMQGPITILKSDNSNRTNYSPQIKILKRTPNNSPAKKVRNKTEDEMRQALKQKEADYIAARNRILGENYDETKPKLDAEDSVRISIIKNPSRTVSPTSPEMSKPPGNNDSLVRQPMGPDACGGFKVGR